MKKCIVLDLDNTLWGGVVGEDGPRGIALGLTPPGAYFVAFQQALLDLNHRGIILAIASANNESDALEVIDANPNMILKRNHFAAMRINWSDKTENIRSIAQELNIGLDSMVFLDDNPENRAAMRQFVPEVETPELPVDPREYAQFLHTLPYFEANVITDEDKMRGNMYVTERLRREAEKQFTDRDAFLKSLGFRVEILKDASAQVARLSQLTEKTNQFNTNKKPLTVEEIDAFIRDPHYAVLCARVTDKFGDYGITAFALVQKLAPVWHIESLLLSCRVIGRGVEEAFLAAIAESARAEGAETLDIIFTPTEKNMPAKIFIEKNFTGNTVAVDAAVMPSWVTLV
ncbi:HAD-IIIC family phosphatase [Candidatus Parcubacteria bacterium]|nr:MAG: HAD-IIIC family phosphatase [Candidatus Parcubacteria bacterium]